MNIVGFLEKKKVIQFFGLALVIAPFINLYVQFIIIRLNPKLYNLSFFQYLKSGQLLQYAFIVSSLIIGLIMLKGAIKAWSYVLVLLGSNILYQIYQYKSSIWQSSWTWLAFAINVLVFLFIADQIVWKIKVDRKSQTILNSSGEKGDFSSSKKIYFSFFSQQPWGQLFLMNSSELVVRCFKNPPIEAYNRIIDVHFAVKNELTSLEENFFNLEIIFKDEYQKNNQKFIVFRTMNMDRNSQLKLKEWFGLIAG